MHTDVKSLTVIQKERALPERALLKGKKWFAKETTSL